MKTTPILSARRNDLDWLRVLAVLLLVPFHAALIFVLSPYAVMYVKDVENSRFLDIFAGWIHQFHMPILFYVAGASSFFALAKRTGGQYLKERILKLLLPAVSGIVLLIPPMTYVTARWQGATGSFWEHYGRFWHVNPADLNGLSGCFTPAHLWFLVYLFLFSLVALPLFLALRKTRPLQELQKIVSALSPFGYILLFVGVAVLAATTQLLGDINPLYYFLLFLTGFFFMADPRIQTTLDRCAPVLLTLGIALEATRHLFLGDIYQATGSALPGFLVEQLNRWCWLLAMLGFGHRYLQQRNNVLKYLSASSFACYIFHLLITTCVGYFVIQWQAAIWLKYVVIVMAGTGLTFLVYEVVRRIPGVRFIFGMRSPITSP